MRRSRAGWGAAVVLSLVTGIGIAARGETQAARPKTAPDLFIAIGEQNGAEVKSLLSRGADANARNTLGAPALVMAGLTGNTEVLQSLLAAGAEVNGSSPFGSALTFSAQYGHSPAMRLLMAKGADVNAGRPDKITILMLAARAGDPNVLREVLARKAPVEAVDNHGSTALIYAARAGKADAVRVLLESGARVDAADVDGWTSLMHAAVNGHTPVVKLLLERRADVNRTDKKGRTALLLATAGGDHPETVAALLDGGADPKVKDAQGRTPAQLALHRGYQEELRLFRARNLEATGTAPLPAPKEAARAGLRQVERSMQVFLKRTGCVSCHHEGLGQFTTGFAQARGFAVDGALAKQQQDRIAGFTGSLLPLLQNAVAHPEELKNVPIVDVGDYAPGTGILLMGMAERQAPATETLGASAMVLARLQSPSGEWRFMLQREPVQSSYFTMTAMAIRALRTYAPPQYSSEVAERVNRARQWLLATPARSTEDRVFRLLGLKWAGAGADERRKAVEELKAAQRADGGWGQQSGMQSDAYATGSALFALNQGGEVSTTTSEYKNGVAFLLRTQDDDGAWYVYKHAAPVNNFFDAEFPYGQSQYSSFAGTCWATLALVLASNAG